MSRILITAFGVNMKQKKDEAAIDDAAIIISGFKKYMTTQAT